MTYWSSSYVVTPIWDNLWMETKQEWGGYSSYVGKCITYISTGLMAWFLGQTVYLAYYVLTGDVPFPGTPDIFFVLIDPLYALSIIAMMRYLGTRKDMGKSYKHLALLPIPIAAIYINYKIFFGDFSVFNDMSTATIFDLIYSFGSTIVMTLIITTTVISMRKLGGKMQSAIYFILVGIILQFCGDILYAFAEAEELRYNGNPADFVFFLSIACIIIGLTRFNPNILSHKGGDQNAS